MDFEKLILLNRFELIDIANSLGIKANYSNNGKVHQKHKEELSTEILDKFTTFSTESSK